MSSLSGRIKISLLGAVALWILARSVYAMELVPVAPSIHAAVAPGTEIAAEY